MRPYLSLLLLPLMTLGVFACGGGGSGGGGSGGDPVVEDDPLVISTTDIPQAQVDVAYSAPIDATGGVGRHNWKIADDSSDALPDPLFINPTSGEIQGTPRAGTHGNYVIKVEVNDGVETRTANYLLRVHDRLSVATTIIPEATENKAFSQQLLSIGGFQSQTWAIVNGTLPAGLSMNADGLISGTPTQDGESTISVEVSDGVVSAQRDLTITISDAILEVIATSIPPVDAGNALAPIQLQASGGTGSYTWALSPNVIDALPNGMSLSASGVLSGTPEAGSDGFHSIAVLVNDGNTTSELIFVIQVGSPALQLVTALLPEGIVGRDYQASLMAGGGTGNYTFARAPSSGPLPEGLSLAADGVISGRPTPNALGTTSVLFSVTDGVNTHQHSLDIEITEPALLDQKFDWTQAEINHFLTRTHFGVTEADQAAVTNMGGLPNFVDHILAKETNPNVESQVEFDTIRNPQFPSRTELARWYEQLLLKSDAPFQEAMGFFWHDHFATATSVLGSTNLYYMIKHINTLRHGSMGNFRQLLFDISIDDQMLVWLDGRLSTRWNPNENYAREFWELFTVGVDKGYTQADIEESSRVFTGFRQSFNGVNNVISFDPNRHDSDDKMLFGRTIKGRSGPDAYLEYYDIVDVTLDELEVAEYIVTKLWEWFAYENPEAEIVAGLSKTFRDNNWEIKPVLRQMLLSNAFYATAGIRPREKSPIEFAIGLMRSTELEVPVTVLDSFLTLSGQRPTDPPDVSGWPSGPQWLSADAMVQRANFAASVRNERSFQASKFQGVVNILPPALNRTSAEVVDHMAGIFNLTLTATQRNSYISYLDTDIVGGQPVGSVFDGLNQTHLEERARGLLYIMTQHPDYNFR